MYLYIFLQNLHNLHNNMNHQKELKNVKCLQRTVSRLLAKRRESESVVYTGT